ncbi:small cardioactive peptides-like isoform X6 [Pecten maximus]|uniref:small cardioactive peptides-like isoform X6 n=1 Tax=Pecten maximus TaxID=6579 RepID=UPI0014591897|nr:small cardioactive peptides-like isoform X6 [Pecten maximus]
MVSGLLSGCVLLVAFSLYTEGKAVSLDRQKRAPGRQHPRLGRRSQENFLAYPRGGRSSNPMAFSRDTRAMFSYPRLGRSGAGFPADVLDGLSCCNFGVKSINGMAMCSASECCSGLQEYRDVKKPFVFTLCVLDSPEEDKA